MNLNFVKSLILDMDGVLWKGDDPICDLHSVFNRLIQLNISYAFATNNSSKHVKTYVDKISSYGIPVQEKQIFTSAVITAGKLKEIHPNGGSFYVIGGDGLVKTIVEHGFEISENPSLGVVAGLDKDFSYDKLKIATLAIRNGGVFYGTNPDLTFPSPIGQAPGAGSIPAAIEASSGQVPKIFGKPFPDMFKHAALSMNMRQAGTLVVGDRLDTDIQGGINAGYKTALVLSGITTNDQLANSKIQPSYVFDNLSDLVENLE